MKTLLVITLLAGSFLLMGVILMAGSVDGIGIWLGYIGLYTLYAAIPLLLVGTAVLVIRKLVRRLTVAKPKGPGNSAGADNEEVQKQGNPENEN